MLPLKPLDREASRALLRRQIRDTEPGAPDLDSALMLELLDELDGLPLAIELAGSSLRSVGVGDLLTNWRTEVLLTGDVNSRQRRHRSIAHVVRSTLSRLDARHLDIVGLCAFFPADFDAAAVEALAGEAVHATLESLEGHSLLEVSRTATTSRYRMLVPIRSEIRSQADPLAVAPRAAFVAYFVRVASSCLERMKGIESVSGVAELRLELRNMAVAFSLADEADDVSSMASIVHSVGLGNGMSPSVGAKSHLQEWGQQLQTRLERPELNALTTARAQIAVAWGLYGSNDGAWYQRWEPGSDSNDVETQAMAAIARFSCGESAQAWELLRCLDLNAASDTYMKAMLCGVGAVVAFEVGAAEGHDLVLAAQQAADERPSHGATFFAGLARSSQALVQGDIDACVSLLESTAGAVDGHGLVTLENMGLAGVAMTVGFILRQRDPGDLLIALLGRYLEQHSLDPASVAMALDLTVLNLDQAGRTEQAATLLGLLDRLGLSMAILSGARAAVEAKVDDEPAWRRAREAGSSKTTFDVLRLAHTTLIEVSEGSGR